MHIEAYGISLSKESSIIHAFKEIEIYRKAIQPNWYSNTIDTAIAKIMIQTWEILDFWGSQCSVYHIEERVWFP